MKLKIEYLSPEQLTPYENNTRKHAPDDIAQIKESIMRDGFNDPIGIWGDKNTIVEGHGRYIAALELHLTEVPVIRLDHLTDDQRRDYAIRHNRTAELSAWDFTALEEEIAALEIGGHEFDGLNFSFGIDDPMDFDEAEEKPENSTVFCKLTFDSYEEYEEAESEIRRLAKQVGAKFTAAKA